MKILFETYQYYFEKTIFFYLRLYTFFFPWTRKQSSTNTFNFQSMTFCIKLARFALQNRFTVILVVNSLDQYGTTYIVMWFKTSWFKSNCMPKKVISYAKMQGSKEVYFAVSKTFHLYGELCDLYCVQTYRYLTRSLLSDSIFVEVCGERSWVHTRHYWQAI